MGKERIDEVFDPEIAIKRAIDYYRNRGYSDKWIEARLKGILDRNKLTDIWKENGIKENYEFRRAYKRGGALVSPYAVIYVFKTKGSRVRLGITVGKKIGKAVKRNRATEIKVK